MARRVRLMVASGVVALLGLSPTATHGADPIQVRLPIGGYFDMVVDEAHQHIFVTGEPSRNNVRVLVIDYHGNVVKIIRDEPGASGLALDTAHSTIYVSLQTTSAIAAIDTVTLTETARFTVAPDAGCPGYATYIEPRVWFGFKCGSGSNVVGIGSLDPTTGEVRAFSGSDYPSSNPVVRTSPALTDTLFAAPHSPGRGSTIDKYQIKVTGRSSSWPPRIRERDICTIFESPQTASTSWPLPAWGANTPRPTAPVTCPWTCAITAGALRRPSPPPTTAPW